MSGISLWPPVELNDDGGGQRLHHGVRRRNGRTCPGIALPSPPAALEHSKHTHTHTHTAHCTHSSTVTPRDLHECAPPQAHHRASVSKPLVRGRESLAGRQPLLVDSGWEARQPWKPIDPLTTPQSPCPLPRGPAPNPYTASHSSTLPRPLLLTFSLLAPPTRHPPSSLALFSHLKASSAFVCLLHLLPGSACCSSFISS